jgi:hypothetical protein
MTGVGRDGRAAAVPAVGAAVPGHRVQDIRAAARNCLVGAAA